MSTTEARKANKKGSREVNSGDEGDSGKDNDFSLVDPFQDAREIEDDRLASYARIARTTATATASATDFEDTSGTDSSIWYSVMRSSMYLDDKEPNKSLRGMLSRFGSWVLAKIDFHRRGSRQFVSATSLNEPEDQTTTGRNIFGPTRKFGVANDFDELKTSEALTNPERVYSNVGKMLEIGISSLMTSERRISGQLSFTSALSKSTKSTKSVTSGSERTNRLSGHPNNWPGTGPGLQASRSVLKRGDDFRKRHSLIYSVLGLDAAKSKTKLAGPSSRYLNVDDRDNEDSGPSELESNKSVSPRNALSKFEGKPRQGPSGYSLPTKRSELVKHGGFVRHGVSKAGMSRVDVRKPSGTMKRQDAAVISEDGNSSTVLIPSRKSKVRIVTTADHHKYK